MKVTRPEFRVKFSTEEKIKCLKEIEKRFKKILYVYEKSENPESGYNYKVFCGGILIFVASSNEIMDGELVSLAVNLNSIINNDFNKSQIKRIVFESRNFISYLVKQLREGDANGSI